MSMELSDQLVSEHMEDQEAVSEELAGRPCVRALDLHKTFKVNLLKDSPKDKVAVDGVSFAMYEGQVFSLLGHNGAGKSTTISMMCGLLSTTKGTCDIFGSDIQQDKMAARQAIGFCPQHNILIDTLTVKEHVELFCAIKGVPADEVEAEVTARLGEIGLADKANNLVMQLSGGMQRKLSVAISLTAGSRFVILDEPTAGMDPVSRRAVWEVLQRNTRNRVILLTTHFMDEADILGDRICILSNGKVRTCGSSLFLKNKFGLGYYLTMTISPDAKVDEKQVAQAIASEAPSSEHASTKARELAYRLRFEDAPRFGAVLRMLQSQREELGIESFGLSMTTLEEVFLRLADEGQADEDGGTMEHSKLAGSTAIDVKSVENGSESLLPKDRAEQPVTSMSVHFKALLRKRIIHSGRRLSDPLCALLTPFFCVLLGCILAVTLNLDSGSTTPLNIGANDMCLPAKALPSFETPFAGSAPKSLGAASSAMDLKGFASTLEMEKYILSVSADSTEDDDQVLGMPGAFAFPNASDGSVVYYNQRAAHATPMMVSLLANASSPRIGLVDWPLEPPKKLVPAALIVTDLLAIGLWFLPSVFVFSIIQDRKANTKHQLRVMGADMKAYWLAQIFADYVISVAVGVLIIILIASFNITGLKGNKLVFIALELLISPLPNVAFAYFVSYFIEDPASARGLLVVCNFLLGMIPYITNIILVLLEYFTASTILTFTCGIFPPFAMLCGLFNLSYVSDDVTISELFSLSPVRPFPGADGTLVAPGTVLIILVVTFPFWTMLTWLMERYYQHGFRACLTKCCKSLFCSGPAAESAAETAAETAEENDIQRDDDVMAEQATVQALAVTDQQSASYDPNGQQYVMVVDGVSKVYPARGAAAQHVAVDDFYLAIPQGECFGLLGPNGAGKTSLVKILTGDQLASAGDGFAARNGTLHSVTSSVDSVYQILGYTPQFDALWDELTGREHLELFAAIKGTPADAVTQTIHKLELDQYADKCAGTYSGGNKRKLSVAIALFSDPTLVFLDEPSTGMDPGAKRKMWDLISDTMKGRGVVLTTHSMEEADVLCQRIAIMVNGRLGCLGSSQHLKTLYGKDYVLEINLAANLCNVDEAGEKVDDFVKKQICAGATLGEMPSPELRNYSLPSGAFDLASAFDLMEANKSTMQVANYSISQTSLEQVFIRFSKFQKVNDELS